MDKALENGEYLLKKSFNKTARVKAAFNPYDPAFNPVQDAITLCIVVLTCLVQCLILNAFYTPYHMLSGGITGIAILLDYTASIPRWVTLVVLNIPVLIIGAKRVNVKFIVFSAIGTICYSVMFSLPLCAILRLTWVKTLSCCRSLSDGAYRCIGRSCCKTRRNVGRNGYFERYSEPPPFGSDGKHLHML